MGVINDAMDYLADCIHIIESGTNGLWKYIKYSNHTYHAWYEGPINIQAGLTWGVSGNGCYYHESTSSLSPPSFSTSVTSFTGAVNKDLLMAYVGHSPTYSSYWLTGFSAAQNNVQVRLDMYGTW